MSRADRVLDIVSLRHPAHFVWRNFPDWHRERLTILIKIDSIAELKHMIDVLLDRGLPLETSKFWDYRGPNATLVRTDSRYLVDNHHSQPVHITSHGFESVRRIHQAEVFGCLCMRQLSIRLEARNARMLRLKTFLAGFHCDDIREAIEKAIGAIVDRLTK